MVFCRNSLHSQDYLTQLSSYNHIQLQNFLYIASNYWIHHISLFPTRIFPSLCFLLIYKQWQYNQRIIDHIPVFLPSPQPINQIFREILYFLTYLYFRKLLFFLRNLLITVCIFADFAPIYQAKDKHLRFQYSAFFEQFWKISICLGFQVNDIN